MQADNKRIYNFDTQETLRLDEFLKRELAVAAGESFSNSKLRRLIIAGGVSVNNRIINRPAYELRGKSKVSVVFDRDKFFYEKQPDDVKFEVTDSAVLFEDENLIFINKPAFFPVEQTIVGNRANLHDAVVDYLWKRNPELRNPPYVGIMHRLDRETSGVILFTKNRGINKTVSEMFQNHQFEKKYYAVVCDKPELKTGASFTVEFFMGRVSGKSQKGQWGKLSEKDGGQYSKTDFTVVEKCKIQGINCAVIQCDLYTGRTHQIRVHLASKNLPILGDELYGGKSAERLFLHAYQLKKETGEPQFDVTAPVPW